MKRAGWSWVLLLLSSLWAMKIQPQYRTAKLAWMAVFVFVWACLLTLAGEQIGLSVYDTGWFIGLRDTYQYTFQNKNILSSCLAVLSLAVLINSQSLADKATSNIPPMKTLNKNARNRLTWIWEQCEYQFLMTGSDRKTKHIRKHCPCGAPQQVAGSGTQKWCSVSKYWKLAFPLGDASWKVSAGRQ